MLEQLKKAKGNISEGDEMQIDPPLENTSDFSMHRESSNLNHENLNQSSSSSGFASSSTSSRIDLPENQSTNAVPASSTNTSHLNSSSRSENISTKTNRASNDATCRQRNRGFGRKQQRGSNLPQLTIVQPESSTNRGDADREEESEDDYDGISRSEKLRIKYTAKCLAEEMLSRGINAPDAQTSDHRKGRKLTPAEKKRRTPYIVSSSQS